MIIKVNSPKFISSADWRNSVIATVSNITWGQIDQLTDGRTFISFRGDIIRVSDPDPDPFGSGDFAWIRIRIRIQFLLRGWIRVRFVLRGWIRSMSDRLRNPWCRH